MSTNLDPTRITVRQHHANEYTVRIARDITEPDDFDDELALLAGVTEDDTVKIQLITRGGNVDTAHLLIRAIRECKAHTIGYIGPTCASAGTAIALACEEWEVDEMSSFMIHTATYGTYGKAGEIRVQVEHTNRVLERWIKNTYSGFLTEDEIERTLNGQDFYFEGEELAARLCAFSERRELSRMKSIEDLQALHAELQEKLLALQETANALADTAPAVVVVVEEPVAEVVDKKRKKV